MHDHVSQFNELGYAIIPGVFSGDDESFITGENGWHAVDLTTLVAEVGHVYIVVLYIAANDQIADIQIGIKPTGRTGIHNKVWCELVDHHGSSH